MKSLEELAWKLVDGEITDTEWEELRQRVETDPAAADEFCALLDLEVLLRGNAPRDVVDGSLDRINEELSQRIERPVMEVVRSFGGGACDSSGHPPTLEEAAIEERVQRQLRVSRAARRRTRLSRTVVLLFGSTSVLLLLATWLWYGQWFDVERDSLTELPVVVEMSGDVKIKLPDDSVESLVVGRSIRGGESLVLAEGEATAQLRYSDGTAVDLHGPTTLHFSRAGENGKRLKLLEGQISADVTPQADDRPMVIVTPQATVRVLGTKLEVVYSDERGTRVDLQRGRIEVTTDEDPPVAVSAGHVALVRPGRAEVEIRPRPVVLNQPRREVTISGLESAVYLDNRKIVGATPWQVVFIDEDDRIEMLPVNIGLRSTSDFQSQRQNLFAYVDWRLKRTFLWDATTRSVVTTLDWEPLEGDKFLDRYVRAVSPQGNWFVTTKGDWRTHDFRLHRFDTGAVVSFERQILLSAYESSPDGRILAIGHSDLGLRQNAIELIDVGSGQSLGILPVKTNQPNLLRFSEDGRRIAVGLSGELQVWDVATQTRVATIGDFVAHVVSLALSPTGDIVAAWSRGKEISLWNVESRAELAVIELDPQIRDMTFSPDGRSLTVVDRSGQLTVWDVQDLR